MNSKNIKICKALVKKFGKDYTVDKIAEECTELTLAIMQLKCETKTDKKRRLNDLYSELADVKIMLRQAEEIFNKKKINKFVTQKLLKKQQKHLQNELTEKARTKSRRASKEKGAARSASKATPKRKEHK